ncbi:hypothetical protein LUZ60_012434 [Juncus effusus]|nr:hypothetical protein LUZ60_012434 [Juncus effusus]
MTTSRTSSPGGSQDGGSKPSTPTSPRTTGRFASPNLSSPVFHSDVYQLRPTSYAQALQQKITQMPLLPSSPRYSARPNGLDWMTEPSQSIVNLMMKLLDDFDRIKPGELQSAPQRFSNMLRMGLQELERRLMSHMKHVHDNNNMWKQKEERLIARLQVKETLAANSTDDSQGPFSPRSSALGSPRFRDQEETNRLMKEKEENIFTISKLKEDLDLLKKSCEEKGQEIDFKRREISRLINDKESCDRKIQRLEQDLEASRRNLEDSKKDLEYSRRYIEDYKKDLEDSRKSCNEKSRLEKDEISKLISDKENANKLILKLEKDLEDSRRSKDEKMKQLESNMEDMLRLIKEKEAKDEIIARLKQELEEMKMKYETRTLELEKRADEMKLGLEKRLEEAQLLLEESRRKVSEIEVVSESKLQNWNQKKNMFEKFMVSQTKSMEDLRFFSNSLRCDFINSQRNFSKELNNLGQNLQVLVKAANRYHAVLTDNRRLHNEVLELKGNIRVYCRIRPFLPGEDRKSSSVDNIGENGELTLSNPSKAGKEGNKLFTFNKVFGPSSTQEQVFLDIRPLVRSVLDGYNVCIFAYGQTGSGKTYTMTGPNSLTEKDWGVNYRALNDLFNISRERNDTILYDVSVQMIEIYNEQVRDLLSRIVNTSQPNGLAVPDAAMHAVKSTSDVVNLMELGFSNRAVGATALNDRSSRSHSILTIHVRGHDLKTSTTLRGSLHLVDLAGSERVDRSEAVGDRLKEAQHINKSLSALGDVIFALAQKNAHVPYRNSKLTQVLQTSLGGHAKTLMFVQVNPDASSYSETLSTLKFAERVSSVELGAAKSNKEGKDVKELINKVSYLKETISKKDEEIERLTLLRTSTPRASSKPSKFHPSSSDSLNSLTLKHSSSSPGVSSLSRTRSSTDSEPPKRRGGSMDGIDNFDNESEDRLSDISDGGLSMGTETDGSNSLVEYGMFPEQENKPSVLAPAPIKDKVTRVTTTRIPKPSPLKVTPPSPKFGPPSPKMLSPLRSVKTKESTTTPKSSNLRKMASTQGAAASSPKTPSKGWK